MIVIRCDRCGAEAAQGECHMRLERSYGPEDGEPAYSYHFAGAEIPSSWRRMVTMSLPSREGRRAWELCADCAAQAERVLCGG